MPRPHFDIAVCFAPATDLTVLRRRGSPQRQMLVLAAKFKKDLDALLRKLPKAEADAVRVSFTATTRRGMARCSVLKPC